MANNGGSDTQGTDMINLNIGGQKMRVQSNTMKIIKGSLLEFLFSGRWENNIFA